MLGQHHPWLHTNQAAVWVRKGRYSQEIRSPCMVHPSLLTPYITPCEVTTDLAPLCVCVCRGETHYVLTCPGVQVWRMALGVLQFRNVSVFH